MHSYPRQSSVFAAFAAACLIAAIAHAAPQSDTLPGDASSGDANAAASQTALAIAGGASAQAPEKAGPAGSAVGGPASAGSAGPARPATRPMTPEQRHELMMLLIMRETSRNPFGALH